MIDIQEDLISILFPVYREPLYLLRQALESIRDQSFTEFEVLIGIDDPKNTAARDLVESMGDPRFKVEINSENLGLVDNLNLLYQRSRGALIARMDADDVAKTHRLARQREILLASGADFSASSVNFISEEGVNLGVYSTFGGRSSGRSRFWLCLAVGRPLIHPTWMMRRQVFDRLNGYRHVVYAEDYDFMVRLVAAKFSCVYTEEILLEYRVRRNSISRSNLWIQTKNYYLCNTQFLLSLMKLSLPMALVRRISILRAALVYPSLRIHNMLSSTGFSRMARVAKVCLYPPHFLGKVVSRAML